MFKKFRKSILTALVAAIALPLILALYLLLPKNNAITVQAEEVLTVSTADELSAQLSANDTVTVQLTSDISSETTFTVSGVKTLDLNGYAVTFTGETGSVISVAEGAEFTLTDGNPTKENTVGDKTVQGGVITGGKVIGCGGGIYVNSNAAFTMKGGNVSGNIATFDSINYIGGGGGVYVENGSFTMEGGNVSGNTSTANYYNGGGGGVYVKGGSFTMKGGSISGNTATASYSAAGGGVCIKNGSFIMADGAISDNISKERGGGVYVENDSPATAGDGEINFTMKGGSISGNTSEEPYNGDGGGVYVKNASFKMEKGTISDNVTQTSGGGVYVEKGSFTMEVGSISGNKTTSSNGYGGGVYVYDNSTFIMNGGTLDKNEAANGGGVYAVSSGSRFEMTDIKISGNKSRCGGGVYLAIGTEGRINGGSIRDNIANGSNGGGIYVYKATLNVDGTEISGCSASTCGGIYIENTESTVVTANISNVTITGCSNLVTDYGSAIYAYGNVTVTLTNGEITGNKKGTATYWAGVEFTISGAPHIYDNEDGDLLVSYAMYKIENLEEGAKIGVTGTPSPANGVFTTGGAITEDNIKCFYSNDQKCIKVINNEASVSADNHDYGEPVWSWADDCTSADATFTCDNCQHVETVTASGEDITSEVVDPASCTSTGETAYIATVEFNGATKTDTKNLEVAMLDHDFAGSTEYNSGGAQHWKICKDCDAEDTDNKEDCDGGTATCKAKAVCLTCGNEYGDVDENNHAWGEWTVSKEAKCTEKGEETRKCSYDETHKETRETDALNHNYGEWTVSKEATCTEKGEETRKCSYDETHKETRETDAINHNYGEWTVSKAATCTEKGEQTRICSNDKTHKETKEIDALNHNYGEWTVSKAATCTEKGEETRICSNDSTHKETRETDAKGHSWGEWSASKEATAEEYGEEQRVCANDSTHIETRQTAKLDAPVEPENNGGLSTGALAAIIAAGILLLLLLIYIVCYFALYRREILLKGKFFDVIYAPMNAIFGKKKKDEDKDEDKETENS